MTIDPSVVGQDVSADQRSRAAAAVVANVERKGTRISVPTAGGPVVWRVWGKGKPLILVHGGGGAWTHWIRNIETLAAHRRVFALDLPGCGESQFVEPPNDPGAIAQNLRETLVSIVGGEESLDFVAFSFGGIVCGHLAALDPDFVGSLVIAGAIGLGVTRKRPPIQMLRRIADPAERMNAVRSNLAAMMIADPHRIDDLAVYIHDQNTRRIRLKSSAISATNPLAGLIERLQCPVCAVWGRQDSLYPQDTKERVALLARFRHPSTPSFIDPGGHWIQYENADAFNDLIVDLLGRGKN